MRVFECFDLLRPGLFVKCWADASGKEPLPKPICGEIGVVERDCFYIFIKEDQLPYDYDGCEEFEEMSQEKGYNKAWIVFKENINKIEIIDELPKEDETEVTEEKKIKLPDICERDKIITEFVKKLMGIDAKCLANIKINNNKVGVIDFDEDEDYEYEIRFEFDVK
jgi:hypothetical protein